MGKIRDNNLKVWLWIQFLKHRPKGLKLQFHTDYLNFRILQLLGFKFATLRT